VPAKGRHLHAGAKQGDDDVGDKAKVAKGAVTTIPSGWRETVLICRKCSKKLEGGFGVDGKTSFRSALRETLRQRGERRTTRLIEVGCFGICPKKGVTAALGSAPSALVVIGRGADPAALFETERPDAAESAG
jgi:hypothetical protein